MSTLRLAFPWVLKLTTFQLQQLARKDLFVHVVLVVDDFQLLLCHEHHFWWRSQRTTFSMTSAFGCIGKPKATFLAHGPHSSLVAALLARMVGTKARPSHMTRVGFWSGYFALGH
jgi:hypothetical protein